MELPVVKLREKLLEKLAVSGRVLLRAPTGSGKSTCVPPMMLDGGVQGMIVVVQPRRIAARMLARRVSQVRCSKLGDEIGYVVRFENCMGNDTRVVYVAESGVLTIAVGDATGHGMKAGKMVACMKSLFGTFAITLRFTVHD